MFKGFGIPGPLLARLTGQRVYGGAIAASLLLHVLLAAALVAGADSRLPEAEETPVMVELVPPPEPEETVLTPPPEPEASEPPPPPQPEAAEPPPEPEISEPEPEPEKQPQPADEIAQPPPPMKVLQPVVEFAEEDSGPRVDLEGFSGQDGDAPDADAPESSDSGATEAGEEQEAAVSEEEVADAGEEQSAEAEPSEDTQEEAGETPEAQEPDPPAVPETVPGPELAVDTDESTDDASGPIVSLITPTPRPAREPRAATPAREPNAATRQRSGSSAEMARAARLYSEFILDNPSVRLSMESMPRSERINLLCMTEMRAQLETANPPRPPRYLPSFRLRSGNVLEPRQAAFHSGGLWFNLAFRCEVDERATKVLNFRYRIGDPVPRGMWARRGFPRL